MERVCDLVEILALEHRVGVAAHEAYSPVLSHDPFEILLQDFGGLVLRLHEIDIEEAGHRGKRP